jgi:hypothetical protein
MLRPKSASAIRKSASAFPPANHLPNKAIPYNSHQFGAEKPLSHLDAIANRLLGTLSFIYLARKNK